MKDRYDDEAAKFLDALELFGLGSSWGGFESLARLQNTRDRTIAKGPAEGSLIRLHIGLEDVEDIIVDLELGFARAWLYQRQVILTHMMA